MKKNKGMSKKDKREMLEIIEVLAKANVAIVITLEPKKRGLYYSSKPAF